MINKLPNKKVKILATIGPASRDPKILEQLVEAGVNVFRINFSHEKHETAKQLIADIRAVEKKVGIPLAIMGDLAGPKIRIGDVEPGVILQAGEKIEVVEEQITGNKDRISLNYPSIVRQLKADAEIYIDDGKLKLRVEKETKDGVMTVVTVGGELKARKGFFGQGIALDLEGLSEKDQADLRFLVEEGADAIALSFVQTAYDINFAKKMLPEIHRPLLVTKLETYRGLENIEEILEATDIIMLARGDLGLSVPMEELPHLQKELIRKCMRKGKPVITATQMLESMTANSLPTRAEVTDVANAILDGTDCVMLSAETASGNYPVETVKMMAQIIRRAVREIEPFDFREEKDTTNAISASIGQMADQIGARLVIAFTESGATARRVSRHRYQQSIIALSPEMETVHGLCFSYNVYSQLIKTTKDIADMLEQARKVALSNKIVPLEEGEPFLIVAGVPFGHRGTTNLIYIERA